MATFTHTRTNPKIAPFNPDGAILVPDPPAFARKLRALTMGGPSELQVIADFDHTLTPSHIGAHKIPCTYEVLLDGALSSEGKEQSRELFRLYWPLVNDPQRSEAEKRKFHSDWAHSANCLVLESGFKHSELLQVLENSELVLRRGALEALEACRLHRIPFTVVSAGIGDLIDCMLGTHEGLRVYANYLQWDEGGRAIGFSSPVVASNKAGVLKAEDSKRANVIVLGDTLEDLTMVQALQYKNCLKIGFLKPKSLGEIEKFASCYDVLVQNEGNMNVLLDVLSCVVQQDCSFSL